MKKTFIKIISVVMLVSMCCSMMSLAALAETTTTTEVNDEGNTVVTETTVDTYVSTEGENPAVDGEVTTLEISVINPEGQLVSESGSKTGTVVTVTEEKGNPETTEGNGSALPAPTVSDVSKSELEVSFEDENGELQFGTQTDSVTPEVDTSKDDYNNIDEETGFGSAQETSTNGNETTVITTEKTQSSVTSEPVVTTPEDGLTRSEVTETTTTVETVTTQTVVVTDRELIANLAAGTTSSTSEVSKELNAEAVGDLNDLLTDMGVTLAPEVAEKVLEGLASGTVPSDPDAKEIVEDLLDEDKDATVTKTESKIEESAAPSIVVSDVKFTVGEKSGEGASAEAGDDVYTTDISFTVVVTTDVAGTTKVTVFDENNNEIKSETVDTSKDSHTLSGLQLTEGMNYNLKFDFSATKDLGADTYVYQASVQTHVEGTGKPENDNNGGNSGNGNGGNNGNHGNGNGSTEVKIHYMSGLGENHSTYEIIDPKNPGIKYTGTLNGSNLTFDMETTDNGFNFPLDGSYVLNYVNNDTGETGEIMLTHKEGNATGDITTEPDAGTNNFNGDAYRDEDVEYGFSYNKTQELSASESITLSFNVNEATEEHSSSSVTTTTVDTKTTVTEKWDKSWDNKYEIEEPEQPEEPEDPEDPENPEYPDAPQPVPLMDDGEVIEEELVPLAKAPQTGSFSLIFAVAAASSGLGLAGLAFTAKREED